MEMAIRREMEKKRKNKHDYPLENSKLLLGGSEGGL